MCCPLRLSALFQRAGLWLLAGGIKAEIYRGKSLKAFLKAKEKEYLSQVLQYVEGDKEKAAKALKISLATLYRKLPDPKYNMILLNSVSFVDAIMSFS